jgi:glycosyltransferase involved in cell wall biosynthesis
MRDRTLDLITVVIAAKRHRKDSRNAGIRARMKLAFVIGSLNRGGAERQIVNFVRTAHPAYANCVVICLSDEGVMADDIRLTGARVMDVGFKGMRSPTVFRALMRLYRVFRRERPDVVYAFLFWGYVLALPVAVVAAPDALRVAARRTMPSFDRPRNQRLMRLRHIADWVSHGVIVNSEALRSAWRTTSPSLASKLCVVQNGVQIPARDAKSEHDAGVVVVSVANFATHKGHATLLRALAQLKDLEWRLLLAGDGPERDSITALAQECGIARRVELLGVVNDVDAVFRQADLAVLASDTEGLPNAVLEAMAHGVPVVATSVGGTPELLNSGAGSLVPPRDPAALAAAIRAYLEDRNLRQHAGDIGRREVEEKYSIEAMRDKTLAAFESFRTRNR